MDRPGLALRRAFAGPAGGVLLMALSTVGFASMHGVIRHMSDQLHPFELAFFRNAFGLIVLVPFFVRYGIAPLRTKRLGLHATRAMINVFAMMMFFFAVGITPLAQLQALGFTAPLFATVLAIVLLGERVGPRRWTALIVGFIGALIVVRPGFAEISLGSMLVLGSSLIWALALIVIKTLARTESSVTITTYMVLFMTPLSLIPASLVWQWPVGLDWLWLVAIGVTGTLSQMAMAQSFRLADATAVMPLDFLKLIWGALIGYLFFAEMPSIWTALGGIVIFAGATYITVRESRLKAAAMER